jgi:hypothetical protein
MSIADMYEEMQGCLERMEALQKHWDDPLCEDSVIRRALRAELRAQRPWSPTGPGAPVARLDPKRARDHRPADSTSPRPGVAFDDGALAAHGCPDSGCPGESAVVLADPHFAEQLPSPELPQCMVTLSCHSSAEPLPEKEMTEVPRSRGSTLSDLLPEPKCDAPRTAPRSPAPGTPVTPDTPPEQLVKLQASAKSRILRHASTVSEYSDGAGVFGRVRSEVRRVVRFQHGCAFDNAIAMVILASSVCVGVEIQCDLDGSVTCAELTHNLEHFFLVIFVLELLIRSFAEGLGILKNGWFRFDAILTGVGVISSWVIEPILRNTLDGSESLGILSQVVILRALRFLRLVRALRFFEQFQEMWKLANGLMRSFRTVLSAVILMVIVVYIFACIGIELITKNTTLLEDSTTAALIQTHFPSLQVSMLSLLQFTNSDSIASLYMPLVVKASYLSFYFGSLWLILTITLMNLITAVIVDTAIAQGGDDRELELATKRKRLRQLEPVIKNIFQELDAASGNGEGDGELSLQEFREGLVNMKEASKARLPADIRNILDSDQLIDVYEHLDADGSGAIDEDEFIDGIFSLALQSVPIETTKILQQLRSHGDVLRKIQRAMRTHKKPSGE